MPSETNSSYGDVNIEGYTDEDKEDLYVDTLDTATNNQATKQKKSPIVCTSSNWAKIGKPHHWSSYKLKHP